MKMNYNDWFFKQYRYLMGARNKEDPTFNDTAWVDIGKRYQTLIDAHSALLNEQPFGVISNNYGFDQLLDLLGRSNYTFDDIDKSLIDTYEMSLKNAMGKMLVNTHAVLFHCTNMDTDVVSMDKLSNYYVIDVPFDQLHFGDRDQFIRQKLHEMHETENDHYVAMADVNGKEISKLLGFSMLCTINGYICNDCMVAFDDKGFKFKVRWTYSSDVNFAIYKLDTDGVYSADVPVSWFKTGVIPLTTLPGIEDVISRNKPCLIHIYDKRYAKTVMSVPNFCDRNVVSIRLINLQQKTLDDLERLQTKTVSIVIYELKNLKEVPNVYPAVNYYDILDSHRVYTEYKNPVTTIDEHVVTGTNNDVVNALELCTPPIILDRPMNLSFQTITNCLELQTELMKYADLFRSIGNVLTNPNMTYQMFIDGVVRPLNQIYPELNTLHLEYLNGAVLTSLVSPKLVDRFDTLMENINHMRALTDLVNVQLYTMDEYYGDNYKAFVDAITAPFRNNALSNFYDLPSISDNYFTDDNSNTFNRPVSEQCFLTLKYNREAGCWLFDQPNIKHFHGIGNTFYIDDQLNGDEVFKFFVLYTDTESPSETSIAPFDMETVFDFDKFYLELEKHIGCARYWYAENKLLKLSKVMYNKYDSDTCGQVLSKILKRKIDAVDLIDIYPSDINDTDANVTSDNVTGYTDSSERAPFAVNFLFYTISMMYQNEDKLQSYLMRKLTDRKFVQRYVDVDVSPVLNEADVSRYSVDYSRYAVAPNSFDAIHSDVPDVRSVFYGLPFVTNQSGAVLLNDPYRFVFNTYDDTAQHYMLTSNDVDTSHYIGFSNPSNFGYAPYDYSNDVNACKLLTFYLNYASDYISKLQTNYTTSFNQTSLLESGIESMSGIIQKIQAFSETQPEFLCENTQQILDSVIMDDPISEQFEAVKDNVNSILHCDIENGRTMLIFDFINRILSTMKQVYITTGFDNNAMKRTRALYLYLKQINNPMNAYTFKNWLLHIDMDLLYSLDTLLAANENYRLGSGVFTNLYNILTAYITAAIPKLVMLDVQLGAFTDSIKTSHIDPITTYCNTIITQYMFNLYAMDEIVYDHTATYPTKPFLVVLELAHDVHTIPPLDQTLAGPINFIFQPVVSQSGNNYTIDSIANICEYAFFDGTGMENVSMSVLAEDGTTIDTSTCRLTFVQVSVNGDVTLPMEQLINVQNRVFDFENRHESFVVDGDAVVSSTMTDMNYELLLGNRFLQLDHTHEEVLNPATMQHGPVDRIYLNDQIINKYAMLNRIQSTKKRMFFKPSQVLHLNIDTEDENAMISVGGKYFVGEKIYLKTDDSLSIFPVIITKVDHAQNMGFVEVTVDDEHSEWFETSDPAAITKYLTTNVTCNPLPDNMQNFLNEFNHGEYSSFANVLFNNVLDPSDEQYPDAYALPGDPIFVSNNTNFVYTRLSWFFHDLIPNRFIDDEHKQFRFMYIDTGSVHDAAQTITIKMINHESLDMTNPELYPVLREEPNDHAVWDKELEVFKQQKYASTMIVSDINRTIALLQLQLQQATTESDKERIQDEILHQQQKLAYEIAFQARMDSYMVQLEPPTTWYNVRAYEDAMIYISNGRAKVSPTFHKNVRDLLYTDDLQVYLYDWEHKHWIDPSLYTITSDVQDYVSLDQAADYTTKNVMRSIQIHPQPTFVPSKKILVYFAYQKSDVYQDITWVNNACVCHFKPLLSTTPPSDHDPYSDIRIRKHFNGLEKYVFDGYHVPTDFSITNAYWLHRPRKSNRFSDTPVLRLCDVTGSNDNVTIPFTSFDLYVRSPFKDVDTSRRFNVMSYTATVQQPMDSFVPDQLIRCICIQNNASNCYDGNVSTAMFECMTSLVDSAQTLTVVNASIPINTHGTFLCTVFQDDAYPTTSGLIEITVSQTAQQLMDSMHNWVQIPQSLAKYHDLPDEFILVPHVDVVIDVTKPTYITLQNNYEKTFTDVMDPNNLNTYNPYEYFVDTTKETRLPIADVSHSNPKRRFVIDTTDHPDVKLVKSTYLSISRYVTQQIPENGFVDVTGYIPTPLSRSRYEFWVNGRCVLDDDVIILSPTTFQLCNQKSLRNLEVVELVDDLNDSGIMKCGNVYIDQNGNTHATYQAATLCGIPITEQKIQFVFNTGIHQRIQDYSGSLLPNPNNKDVEDDILIGYESEADVTSYQQLHHVPSINGASIYHLATQSIGIHDIPTDQIVSLLDQVWNRELTTNPLFPITHQDQVHSDSYLDLRVKKEEDGSFIVYAIGNTDAYFTLYLSTTSNGTIDDDTTRKIVPFIKTGTYVIIPSTCHGLWLHSTYQAIPILLK